MPRQAAMRATHLDWEREFCKQGCKEWIPWYQNKRGQAVYGCRLGAIPEKSNGQWQCRHKLMKQKGLTC